MTDGLIWLAREMDGENGPLSFCTFDVDRALVILDNFVYHG